MRSFPIIFMFSGQGSQYYQMGINLFENNPIFKKHLQNADACYLEMTGMSLIKTLYNPRQNKMEPFTHFSLTHPAIYIIEYALAKTLLEKQIQPDFLLSSSVGEITAATITGIVSFSEGLQIIIQQVKTIEEHCQRGTMIAILNDINYDETDYLQQYTELAAINFPKSFVVSTPESYVRKVIDYLKHHKIAFQTLPIPYAFHSSWIDTAKSFFLNNISNVILHEPLLPLISCMTASLLDNITLEHFWNCIRKPIFFQKTIQQIEINHPAIYIDVGPSGTLATSVKYNLSKTSSSKYFSILTPYGVDTKNFDHLLQNIHHDKK